MENERQNETDSSISLEVQTSSIPAPDVVVEQNEPNLNASHDSEDGLKIKNQISQESESGNESSSESPEDQTDAEIVCKETLCEQIKKTGKSLTTWLTPLYMLDETNLKFMYQEKFLGVHLSNIVLETDPMYIVKYKTLPDLAPKSWRKALSVNDCNICRHCKRVQPFQIRCKGCEVVYSFYCFNIRCFELEPMESDWRCRFCSTCDESEPLKDHPNEAIWFRKRFEFRDNVEVFKRRAQRIVEKRQLTDGDSLACTICELKNSQIVTPCFLCNEYLVKHYCHLVHFDPEKNMKRMNATWFCGNCSEKNFISVVRVENYCCFCRHPMPIRGTCETCKEDYSFTCLYPPRCITTMFPESAGLDIWKNCEFCLTKKYIQPMIRAINKTKKPPVPPKPKSIKTNPQNKFQRKTRVISYSE